MQPYKKILGKVVLTAEGAYRIDKCYEPISLVTDEETGKSYISRKEVPVGIQINNREYWQPVASAGINDTGVIILNRKNDDGQIPVYDLKSATESVAAGDRKGGVILGFLSFNPETDTIPAWRLYQYNDVSASNWTNVNYWLPLDYTNKYAGWFDDEKALYVNIPFPKTGMYAYVGNSVSSAVVYRCYNNGIWQSTEDKAFSGVINLADEEDITSKHNKLQFKDKEYNPDQFSGLGKMRIRKNIIDGKNILTQNNISLSNTVYEIRYDFDLNGETLEIPEGCVLDFQGGSFSNGALSGDFDINSGDVKIFTNIRFSGACVNRYFRTDWFVGSYASSLDINDTSDATAELQQMFDSGIQKVYFCNNHYYKITDTITIDAKIVVDGARQREGYSNEALNKAVFGSFDKPLMVVKAKNGETVTSTTINNLYLYRVQKTGSINEANNFKRDIPTLYVDCTEGNIWGLYIWAIIELNPVSSVVTAADGKTTFNVSLGGYRGIEIYASNNHYASYITIDGYIHDFYEGIKIHKDQTSSWITAVTLKYDSEGCYGGYVCTTTTLEGQHQSRHYLPKNEDAFFDIDGACMINGAYIWDVQYLTAVAFPNNEIQSTRYAVAATGYNGLPPFYGCINKRNNRLMRVELDYYGLKGEAKKEANILADAFYKMNYQKFANGIDYNNLSDFVCEVVDSEGNIIPVTEENTFGYNDLFYPERLSMDDTAGTQKTFNTQRVTFVKGVTVKEYHFAFKANFFNRVALILHCFSSAIDKYIITVDGEETVLNRPSNVQFYNPYYFEIKHTFNCQVDVRVVYRFGQSEVNLPFVGLCGDSAGEMIGPWGGSVYGPLVCREITNSNANQSFVRYLGGKAINKFIGDTWEWYTYLTFKQFNSPIYPVYVRLVGNYHTITLCFNAVSKVVTCMVSGYIDPAMIKIVYKEDSDTGYITWQISGARTHNLFVDEVVCRQAIDFTEVEDVSDFTTATIYYIGSTVTGTTSKRPVYGGNYTSGASYFDTTLGRPIWWSGEKWIEADGTPTGAKKGSTEERPDTLTVDDAGYQYFDTTISKPIYWSGSEWVDASGVSV